MEEPKVPQIYYERHGVILASNSYWEQGKGDCIVRTLIAGLGKGDPFWINACDDLIENNIRWPDALNSNVEGRSQESMTRDPYVIYIAVNKLVGRIVKYRSVNMPFWLHRQYIYHWQKGLSLSNPRNKTYYENRMILLLVHGTKTEKLKTFFGDQKWFIRGLRHKFGIHSYSLHLWCWMAFIIKSERIQHRLLPYIPKWNLLCRVLCNDQNPLLAQEVKAFEPRQKYSWTEDVMHLTKMPDGQIIQPDKDILMWAWNEHERRNNIGDHFRIQNMKK